MKLFALAATTAVTARRVDSPAPGFINEQGGYWADQISDQSRHYQQPPQPSHQQQQVQKPQCAEGYFFNAPGKPEAVFMEKNGENDEKPIYSGWFDGEEQFLFWAWDRQSNPINAVVQAVPGNWFFGPTVGDVVNAISSSTTYGLRHCPTDQQVQWFTADTTLSTFVTLKSGQKSQNYDLNQKSSLQCCKEYEWTISEETEPVMMKREPSKSASGQYYYTGFLNGVKHFMYFKFLYFRKDQENFYAPYFGHWYIGKVLDDPESALFFATGEIIPYPASQSCPNDSIDDFWYNMLENKPMGKPFELKCADWHWRKLGSVTTCADKKSDTNYFYGKHEDKCKFEMVVQELVKTQVNQLLVFRPDAESLNLMQIPNDMATIIRNLKQERCLATFGLDGTRDRYGDYIQGCSSLCVQIKDIKDPRDMHDVFYWIVNTLVQDFNANRNLENLSISHRESCLGKVNDLIKKVNVFAPFTGYVFHGRNEDI